jgi:MFS family permease
VSAQPSVKVVDHRGDEARVDTPAFAISPRYRSYAMILLMLIYVVNHLDRQVVNILAESIKHDLKLADWQVGLMTGLAFAVLYTTLGLPIARLAERGDRPMIITVSAAVWSGFTMLCGITQNFTQLVAARIGVGIGEAGCTPPAHSLIIDYNPPERRSSALAFYGMGSSFGTLVGMVFGGLVADAHGWRTAFLFAGVPGLLLAILARLTLREPRRLLRHHSAAAPPSVTLKETLHFMRTKRSFWFLLLAGGIKALLVYGLGSFVASFFLRNHASGVAAAVSSVNQALGTNLGLTGFLGVALGLLSGFGGVFGMLTGGYLADRFGTRDARNYLYIAGVGAVLTVPTLLAVVTLSNTVAALFLVGLYAYVGGFSYGPTYNVAMSVARPQMRATASALMLFASNLIGLGLGPLIVGFASDYYAAQFGAAEGLRRALFLAAFVGLVPAGLYFVGARTVRADLE